MKPAHQRLEEAMESRRFALGIRTWRALSEKAGISYETLRSVRAGGNPGPATADGLERALLWEPGSIKAILDGRGATPLLASQPELEPEPDIRELAKKIRDLTAQVKELDERDRQREAERLAAAEQLRDRQSG